jgi:4-diphosphocytidyl-2-C-methyl-D-erythritol kinase
MDRLILQSPAKINIGLNIINKRPDGYHNIETIYYPLLLSDLLTFEKSDVTKFKTNSIEIAGLNNNLILLAKNLIEKYCKKDFPLKIFLEKNIPTGAGLGGGSSNAATTLKAINKIFNLDLSYPVLKKIALELGSDVPFFLDPQPAFATSRGEVLNPVNLSLSCPILIINPGIHISTKWAFNEIEIAGSKNQLKNLSELKNISLNEIIRLAQNDFESVVFKKYPILQNIKEKLLNFGADYSSMSGSGSTVYGIFSNLQSARRAKTFFESDSFTYLNYPVNQGSIT